MLFAPELSITPYLSGCTDAGYELRKGEERGTENEQF
jgi:hypothetical protein